MTLMLYHRTTIADAGGIVRSGFEDLEWDFGLQDARTGEDAMVTGVWLSDRPLGEAEGIGGDALVEVTLDLDLDELGPFELEGLLWDARIWVAPAEFVNGRGQARILEVDPRTSWFHEAWNEDVEAEGDR
jgi:hypothetical protein